METIQEAKQHLKDNWEIGTKCPCCKQTVKLYKRNLPVASALVLVKLYGCQKGNEYVHLPPILEEIGGSAAQGGYCTISHFWGLIEQRPGYRQDGSNHVGWWRLTDKGKLFVEKKITVPQKAHIFNNTCYGFSGKSITINDALGNKFKFNELWSNR